MTWQCVTVDGLGGQPVSQPDVAGLVSAAWRAAGSPDGGELWQRRRGDGATLWFLSPVVAALLPAELAQWQAQPCDRPDGRDAMVRSRL